MSDKQATAYKPRSGIPMSEKSLKEHLRSFELIEESINGLNEGEKKCVNHTSTRKKQLKKA